MRRRIMSVVLATGMFFSATFMALAMELPTQTEAGQATNSDNAKTAEESNDDSEDARRRKIGISIYGEMVKFSNAVIQKDNINYVPLREFCEYLGSTVSYDNTTKKITVKKEKENLVFYLTIDSKLMQAKGRYFYMNGPCFKEGDTVYVTARAMAKVFGMCIWFDHMYPRILFAKGQPFLSADEFYDADEIKWMSQLISAEAKGEPFEGQLAVGSVVINRVNSAAFPNTIYKVIFQKNNGVQFSPTANGQIYKTPTESCVIAAKIILEGENTLPGALYFVDKRYCKDKWVQNNRPFCTRIGNHWFYY